MREREGEEGGVGGGERGEEGREEGKKAVPEHLFSWLSRAAHDAAGKPRWPRSERMMEMRSRWLF
jgi:hypothetical protein